MVLIQLVSGWAGGWEELNYGSQPVLDSSWILHYMCLMPPFFSAKKAFCNQAGTDAISMSYALEPSREGSKHLLCWTARSSSLNITSIFSSVLLYFSKYNSFSGRFNKVTMSLSSKISEKDFSESLGCFPRASPHGWVALIWLLSFLFLLYSCLLFLCLSIEGAVSACPSAASWAQWHGCAPFLSIFQILHIEKIPLGTFLNDNNKN